MELTNKPELLEALGNYFKEYKSIEKIEIQPYHKLGVHRWKAFGWDYQLKNARENTEEELQNAKRILEPYFKAIVIN